MNKIGLKALLPVLTAALLLAACGGDEKKAATQVAAKVNKEEISVHQINNVLSRSGNIPQDKAKEASRQILDRLVDQELLVQKALEKKLDRDAKVMQSLDAARRQILSQAYMEQVAGAVAKPTPEEVKAFYSKHPELFGERRVYRFQETALSLNPETLAQLREEMKTTKTSDDLYKWLRAKNIPFNTTTVTKAAEQLPLELAPRFHQMKDGQIAALPSQGGLTLVQLLASQQQPMDEKAATPFIEQFLANQKKMEAAEQERKQLRAAAKIEFMGDFADMGKEPAKAAAAAPAATPTAAQPAATAATAPAAAAPATTAAPAKSAAAPAPAGGAKLDTEAVAKGLPGLK